MLFSHSEMSQTSFPLYLNANTYFNFFLLQEVIIYY